MPAGLFIPSKIIVHNSATKDSGTVSWGAIRHYHMTPESEGGPIGGPDEDIGYHAGVELVQSGNYLYYEALFGRPWDTIGAHTRGQNEVALGICFVGNYDLIEPEDGMLEVGAKVIALWMKIYGILKDKIFPHSYFDPRKSCPGTRFSMDRLLSKI